MFDPINSFTMSKIQASTDLSICFFLDGMAKFRTIIHAVRKRGVAAHSPRHLFRKISQISTFLFPDYSLSLSSI